MKKFFTFMTAALFAVSMFAEEVTLKYTGTSTTNMAESANNASSVNLDDSFFTVTSDKGGGSNHVGMNKDGTLRLYAKNGNGTAMTVSMVGGSMKSIKFTFAQRVDYSLTAGGTAVEVVDGDEYEINATTFTIKNISTLAKNNQVQIKSIAITCEYDGTVLSKPVIGPDVTSFEGSLDVTISAAEGAKIFYTLDESDPTVESTEYEAPFTITTTTLVKAIAAKDEQVSPIAEKKFSILDTISVSEARKLIDDKDAAPHFVRGVVSGKVFDANKTFNGKLCIWMTDEENSKDSLEAYQIFAGPEDKAWESLVAAQELIGEGDTILIYAKKLTYYEQKKYYEADGGHFVAVLAKFIEDPTIQYDTLSVQEAIDLADALADNTQTETKYFVEGFADHVQAINPLKGTQIFFMEDNLETADQDSVFEAYLATPRKEGKMYPVLAGDKVRAFGYIKKYIDTKNGNAKILEIVDPDIEFLIEVEGDRTIEIPTIDTISVDSALAIGRTLAKDAVSKKTYVIEGYISHITEAYTEDKGNQTFWMADSLGSRATSNADSAFYVYRGKPNTNAPILRDAKVRVTCQIKNYNDKTIENDGTNVLVEELIPGVPEEVRKVTVAEAMEIGKKLTDGKVSPDRYEIEGYVSHIDELFADGLNETFWITDKQGSRASSTDEGAFEVYRGKPTTGKEIGLDGKVHIEVNIKNFKGTVESDGTNIDVEVLEQGSLYADTITVRDALAKIQDMKQDSVTEEYFVVKCYVAEAGEWQSKYVNLTAKLTDKFNRLTGELTGYHIRISQNNSKKLTPGTYVYAVGHLTNSEKGPRIAESGALFLATAPKVDTVEISVAEAIEIASQLEKGDEADIFYSVTGYVADIVEKGEGTQSFWMSDDPEDDGSDDEKERLYIDMANIATPAAQHQKVRVIGWVGKDTEGDARILQGDAEIVPEGQGIEQIVLTEKAQKVMVDGAIYIIRDNKLFNLQGAQVR